ncbi:MAG: hypothetical protein EA342_18665 [Leptolyngbya sp. LCM1.Bin17]|nr:MAG: hypothetical protein EA342_18665 [Leptolyngbya sp. LCM1.Bin17]
MPPSNSDPGDRAPMPELSLGSYVPLEIYRSAATIHDPSFGGKAWNATMLTLLLTVLGLVTLESAPRTIDALSMQA